MALKKSTGNMYEFVTHMWAPVLGTCKHDCSYCYMKNRRFELGPIRINEKSMRNKLGENNIIFVYFMHPALRTSTKLVRLF